MSHDSQRYWAADSGGFAQVPMPPAQPVPPPAPSGPSPARQRLEGAVMGPVDRLTEAILAWRARIAADPFVAGNAQAAQPPPAGLMVPPK